MFMKKIGFVYGDRVRHYEHTEYRQAGSKMCVDYIDWIQNYRTEGCHIYYKEETWIFKNMAYGEVWKCTIENNNNV